MSFPVYVKVGSLAVHPHWIFEGLAYVVGIWSSRRARRRFGDVVDSKTRWRLTAAALAGGFAGSRLLSYVDDPRLLPAHWTDPALLGGGKTIVGGLVGGLIAVELTKRVLDVRIATGDVLALPLIGGLILGRIGCFLSGLEDQSYGLATRLPWGIDFGDGIARHPTQLYEIVFLTLLALVIATAERREVGDRFKIFLLGYMAFRLAVDFLKPDVRVGGLSMIQWVCLATLAFYAPHLPRLVRASAHA